MNTDLLQRYVTGDVSEEEALEVAKWISENDEHLKEYHAARKLQDVLLWRNDAENVLYKESTRTVSLKAWTVRLLRVASIVLVVFSLTYWWTRREIHQYSAPQQSIHTPNGQRAELILADGTRVWLNSNTT